MVRIPTSTLFDDVEHKRGKYVEAQRTQIPLVFDTWKTKLDLSEENYQALRDVLRIWFDASGIEVSPVMSVPNAGTLRPVERPESKAAEPSANGHQVWPDPKTGKPGPYAMLNKSGRWTKHPGLAEFSAANGGPSQGRLTDPDMIELYEQAREDGSFTPSPRQYPVYKRV